MIYMGSRYHLLSLLFLFPGKGVRYTCSRAAALCPSVIAEDQILENGDRNFGNILDPLGLGELISIKTLPLSVKDEVL